MHIMILANIFLLGKFSGMVLHSQWERNTFGYHLKMENYPFLNDVMAKLLRERRAELGMSKRKLSEEAMIERAYITRLEKGQCNVSVNVLFYLCEALKIEPDDFLKQVKSQLHEIYKARKF